MFDPDYAEIQTPCGTCAGCFLCGVEAFPPFLAFGSFGLAIW